MRIVTRPLLASATALAWLAALPVAHAQNAPAPDTDERLQTIQQGSAEIRELAGQRRMSLQRAEELEAEVDAIKKDRTSITNALIQAAKTEKQLTTDLLELEGRIEDLVLRETGLRASLNERRGLLAEVLAGLQRMGLNPPPALLVTPEDALSSVRSSILLSAVVPEMRTQTAILFDDLRELASVRASLDSERQSLDQTRIAQRDEQVRLELLLKQKRDLEGQTIEQLAAEQRRAAELAARADNLGDLVSKLRAEIAIERETERLAREAAERARIAAEKAQAEAEELARLAEERAKAEAERAKREAIEQERLARLEQERAQTRQAAEAARLRTEALRRAEEQESARPQLLANVPFTQLRGQLAKPVGGRTITAFGGDDGLGTRANGDTIEARAGAVVTAPADAEVLYAGPFRAYGQLLILDVGENYQIVMAGMSALDIVSGQRLLAGEPVGTMGNIQLASVTAAATNNSNPKLYVEFRRNGEPVDPSPWWE